MEDYEDEEGCGWSWDHTIREGSNTCDECGAECQSSSSSQKNSAPQPVR